MIRRMLRHAVAGLFLLSLVACCATAWLWWHARPGVSDRVDVAAGTVLVRAWSLPAGVNLSVIRGWNSPPGVWARSAAAPGRPNTRDFLVEWADSRAWEWGWWQGRAATVRAAVGPDGRCERVTASEVQARLNQGALSRQSPPLRHWAVYRVPHWHLLLATAVPPALWAAGWSRRAWRHRRRARLGLCRRCGYDLRETPERCPECGAAPAREAA